ncbi:hypothetical protein IGB42_00817 [Andreprevotia sp. IGB-42]|uniref:GtrA family protein n=1 Tax=Andreprevotia sp. IGB-42 TaxID=2497473 RepID=UPI00135B408F|nr:GtrA family protein [Andreprevotia sp. IGB-42]KAF0814762.1 hypothetical protein IGB42_00817 [Andreprevotia sp. IGB-42]
MARPAIGQFARYVITGGLSAAMEYGLFALTLKGLGWRYLVANTVVYLLVFGFNFWLNRSWTFQSRGGIRRQLTGYTILLGFNLLASNAVLYALSHGLGLDPLYAKPIVMVMVVGWNFVIYKRVIYR